MVLTKRDGTITNNQEETMELFLKTHFLGCVKEKKVTALEDWNRLITPTTNRLIYIK